MAEKRGIKGEGNIRKRSRINKDGSRYEWWEGRITVGSGDGKEQKQRTITGKTQAEVRKKLQESAVEINNGTYQEPLKMTVGEWLEVWATEYLGEVKPFTVASYKTQIRVHIAPALGRKKLQALTAPEIQHFYNSLSKGDPPLSPKSIKNIHGVLHRALSQAVDLGYIRFNPSDACKLPRVVRKDIKPLDDEQIAAFLGAVAGHRFETLYTVTLFTGLREGEALGLLWDRVDFRRGVILVNQQLQREKKRGGEYGLVSLKNDRFRVIAPAPWVMKLLQDHRRKQLEGRFQAGDLWEEGPGGGYVFCNEIGQHLATHTVYKDFKKLAASIGLPEARFHDLRHSYAVAAIRAGDDIKTVQSNLGHATAAFTLDIYGHVTDQMKKASADRMEAYIRTVQNL